MKNSFNFFACLFFVTAMWALSSCKSARVEQSKPVIQQPVAKKEEAKPAIEEKKIETPKEIKFALLMPFNLSENFKEPDTSGGEAAPGIDQASIAALQFYEGAKIAVDSLAKENIKVNLLSYDAPGDSVSLVNLMYKQPVMTSDLVFSGIGGVSNSVLASTAKKHHNFLVTVQSTSTAVMKDNPYVILSVPSSSTQCEMMSRKLLSKYNDGSFFILHRDIKKENDLASLFMSQMDSLRKSPGYSAVEVKNVIYDAKNFENFQSSLSTTKRNIILVPTSDEAFISPILSKINSYNYANIVIAGLPTWENFESIDFSDLKNLQVIIFSSTYLELENSNNRQFRKQFVELYKTDPLINAYQGFDLVYSFAKKIYSEGIKWSEKLSDKFSDPFTSIRLRQNSTGDGYENTNVAVLLFKDYALKKLE